MAIVSQQQQDQQQGQQNPTGGPTQISGTSAGSGTGQGTSTGTGAGASSPVAQNTAPQASQGYTDVASYLNANQAGSQQLGNQVASNLTNQYNTTKSGIDTSAQAATQAANTGYVPENTQLIQQVAANPTASAANADTLSQYQGQLNDTYSGPTNWADLGTQQGNVSSAQQEANLINTPGGANVLTQQAENINNPGQTSQGINQLDTLLLTGNPGAMGTVQAAADPYKNLNDYINQQNTAVTGAITSGQNAAQQTSQNAQNALMGTYGNLQTQVQNELAQAQSGQAQTATQQAQLQKDIANLYGGQAVDTTPTTLNTFGSGQSTPWYNTTNYTVGSLNPQDLSTLGLSGDQWTALQQAMQQAGTTQMGTGGHNFAASSPTSQINLAPYLNVQAGANPTAATVANADQYAQMAAINQLMGGKAPTNAILNPQMANQAGTYAPGKTSFDYDKALANAQSIAQQEQDAANQETSALSSGADLSHAQGQHGGFGGFLNGLPLGIAPGISNAINPQNKQLKIAHGGEVPEMDEYLDKAGK